MHKAGCRRQQHNTESRRRHTVCRIQVSRQSPECWTQKAGHRIQAAGSIQHACGAEGRSIHNNNNNNNILCDNDNDDGDDDDDNNKLYNNNNNDDDDDDDDILFNNPTVELIKL